jgi:hypothetical protein
MVPLLVGHGIVDWLQIGRYPRHVISLFFRLLYPWYWPSSCWNFIMTCAMTVYYYILNLLVSSWEKLRRPSHRRTHGEWRLGRPISSTLCCCSFSFVCASSVVVSSSSLCVCLNSMSCINCCVCSAVHIGRGTNGNEEHVHSWLRFSGIYSSPKSMDGQLALATV